MKYSALLGYLSVRGVLTSTCMYLTICLILLNGCFHVHVDEDEDDERITVRSDEEMAAMFQAVSSLSYELNFN